MESSDIEIVDLKATSEFHVGVLSVSLIVGLAYGGFAAYCCWVKENILLSHIRNLVIALTCRTFFTLLAHAVIVLQLSVDVAGDNTLVAFEIITLNLVVGFWLYLTIYLHARVQNNFNSEPNLKFYQFVIPGVGVFFAFVWIFVMEGDWSNLIWFQPLRPPLWSSIHWITNSIQLLYLLIQLGLVTDMGRMLMKYSLDSDATTLSRKIAALLGAIVFIFWLEFGFRVGRPTSDGYLYFYYLLGGLQCAGLCPIFYFFEKWSFSNVAEVYKSIETNHRRRERKTEKSRTSGRPCLHIPVTRDVVHVLNKIPHVSENVTERGGRRHHQSDDIAVDSGVDQGIVTIESLMTDREMGDGRTERQIIEERKDVVYSSVVQPEKLKKTIDLYKRFEVIPKNDVTIIGGEEFYECLSERKGSDTSEVSESTSRNIKSRNLKTVNLDKVKKKNAFYSSKYLIVEPKEKNFLRYLENRPSISSTEEGSIREEKRRADSYTTSGKTHSDELVKNWLNDCSDDPKSNNRTNPSRRDNNPDPATARRSSTKTTERSERHNRTADSRTPSISDTEGRKLSNRSVELTHPPLSKTDRSSNV